MHYQLVVNLNPSPDSGEEFHARLSAFATRIEGLPGCISAGAFADLRRSNALVFIEQWASSSALEAHLKSESFRSILEFAHNAAPTATPEVLVHEISQTTDALTHEGISPTGSYVGPRSPDAA